MPKPTKREQEIANHQVSGEARDMFMRLNLDCWPNMAIVATAFRVSKKNVIPVDVIANVRKEGDEYIIQPMMIVVSQALEKCLIPPEP